MTRGASTPVLDGGTDTERGTLPGADSGAGPAPARSATGLILGPWRSAVPCARLHARHVLREWGVTGDPAESVELVVSELVTNAVQASAMLTDPVPAAVQMWLLRDVSRVLVEVADLVAGQPAAGHPDDSDVHGRGLMIVGAVSDDWGTYALPAGGKVVWASLAAPRAAGRPAPIDLARDVIAARIEADRPGWLVDHRLTGWTAVWLADPRFQLTAESSPELTARMPPPGPPAGLACRLAPSLRRRPAAAGRDMRHQASGGAWCLGPAGPLNGPGSPGQQAGRAAHPGNRYEPVF